MIHQLIFAHPRPGMTEPEFQDYWRTVHAVRYASKIPQIRRYRLALRDSADPAGPEPLWSGVAEIWLADEQEQLASLQTPEFLDGARLDEPRWAAFWRTLVLDTDAHVVLPPPDTTDGIKVFRLAKRRAGLSLDEFRQVSLGEYAERLRAVPGLRGHLQGFTRDGAYAIGEAVLDTAHQLWFDDPGAWAAAQASDEFRAAEDVLAAVVEPRYMHQLVTREHWVIGPASR